MSFQFLTQLITGNSPLITGNNPSPPLENEKPQNVSAQKKSREARIAEVQKKAFDDKAWLKKFGVKTERCVLPPEFYEFWFAIDPITSLPNHKVHLKPILSPQTVTPISLDESKQVKSNTVKKYNFKTLGALAKKPLETHIFKKIDRKAGKVPKQLYWIVARKEPFKMGASSAVQKEYIARVNTNEHFHYENLPSALDVATVALISQTDKKCFFHVDPEKSGSRIRCEEKSSKKANAPHLDLGCLEDKHDQWTGLKVGCCKIASNRVGIVGLQKFLAQPIQQEDNEMDAGWEMVEHMKGIVGPIDRQIPLTTEEQAAKVRAFQNSDYYKIDK